MKTEISPDFLLLPLWLILSGHEGLFAALMLSVAVHEAGHLTAILLLGGKVHCLKLSLLGCEIDTDGNLSYGRDFLIAISGPVFSFLLSAGGIAAGWELLSGLSFFLGLLNLLPFHFLDGGRCLWSGLSALFPHFVPKQGPFFLDLLLSCFVLLFGWQCRTVYHNPCLLVFALVCIAFTVAKRGEIV